MAAYFQTFPLRGQEGVLDDVFIDGKTEQEGLRQVCPVSCDVRGDVKTSKEFLVGIS